MLHELADVGEPRQILQRQRLIGQQRRDHQRQRGVLGAGNRNRALQLGAPANLYAIHRPRPSPRPKRLSNFKPASPGASGRRRVARRGRILRRAAALLRLASLQILPQRSGEPFSPLPLLRLAFDVRAHRFPVATPA